jgi:hypothetical protein
MTPTDLLDLRRRVARVLPQPIAGWAYQEPNPYPGQRTRYDASWWAYAGHAWLPVLEDDGTVGALLGELVRRGRLHALHAREGLRPCVVIGPRDEDYIHADHIGHALAAALVAVSEAP